MGDVVIEWDLCRWCYGTGREYARRCEQCEGRGEVEVSFERCGACGDMTPSDEEECVSCGSPAEEQSR